MAEDIILRYRAETDELTKELNLIIEQQEKLEQSADKTSKDVQRSVSVEATALKNRQQLIEKELQTIGKLEAARKRASDPKLIEKYNQAIAQSERNIKSLKSATEQAGKDITKSFTTAGNSIKNIGLSIAAGFGAAFSVQAVVQFARASVDAFLEAEDQAKKLEFAIINIAGESQEALERLNRQAEQLQDQTFFDDEAIKNAQAALSAFGLTADQIEETLPILLDFAVVSGTDLPSAVQQMGTALEGTSREFKKYGAELDASNTKAENLAEVQRALASQTGAAAEALKTQSGQLKNFNDEVSETQETIGEILSQSFINGFQRIFDLIKATGNAFLDFFKTLGLIRNESSKTQDSINLLTFIIDKLAFTLEIALIPLRATLAIMTAVARTIRGLGAAIITGFNEIGEVVTRVGNGIAAVFEGIGDFDAGKIRAGLAKIKAPVQDFGASVKKAFEDGFAGGLEAVVDEQTKATNAALEQSAKLLTSDELRKKSLTELIALQKQYSQDLTNAGRQNLDAIEKEIEARKKLNKGAEDQRKAIDDLVKVLPILSTAYQNLSEDQLRLLGLFEASKTGVGDFREEVEKLTKELESDAASEFEEKLRKLNEERLKAGEDVQPVYIKQAKKFEETWLGANERVLQDSINLVNQLAFLSSQFTDQRIEQLQTEQDRNSELLTEEERLLQDSLDKRIISEGEYEKKSEALRLKRVENEKKLQAAINKEKRKQALLDRINAVFEITINTAIAATKALATPPAPNVVLAALAGALGAAQLATALAAPIPAYAKGTKKAKGGMSLIGEQGAEVMYVPKDAKILPAQKTKNYGEVLDAMYDNRFDRFILDRYVAPALAEQKKRYENKQQETFASNIVNSMTVNGLTLGDMMYANKKGVSIRDKAELAEMIGKEVASRLPTIDLRRI